MSEETMLEKEETVPEESTMLEKEESTKSGDVKEGITLGEVDEQGNEIVTDDRPENVPEKFWDSEKKELNSEAMLKSYSELEKMLRTTRNEGAPESYEVELPDGVADKFKEFNLSEEQAKNVMETINSTFLPEIQNTQKVLEQKKLASEWNTDVDSMSDRMKTISNWAYKALPEDMVAELGKTAAGIITLEGMMTAKNKANQLDLGYAGTKEISVVTQESIERAVADPKYKTSKEYRAEVMVMAERFAEQNKKSNNLY